MAASLMMAVDVGAAPAPLWYGGLRLARAEAAAPFAPFAYFVILGWAVDTVVERVAAGHLVTEPLAVIRRHVGMAPHVWALGVQEGAVERALPRASTVRSWCWARGQRRWTTDRGAVRGGRSVGIEPPGVHPGVGAHGDRVDVRRDGAPFRARRAAIRLVTDVTDPPCSRDCSSETPSKGQAPIITASHTTAAAGNTAAFEPRA